jgi:hypothetical protein
MLAKYDFEYISFGEQVALHIQIQESRRNGLMKRTEKPIKKVKRPMNRNSKAFPGK